MAENTNFLSPVGRIVQGHPMRAQDKNMNGQPLTDKQGNPRVNYFMGVAFSKTDPAVAQEFGAMWALFQQTAQSGFPGGQYNAPGFSWKIIDGDGLDAQGQPYANREGFAGHFIIRFNSGFAPKIYTAGGASQIVDESQLKCGYYVRVYGSVAGNGNQQKPGIYVNMNMVELVGYGEEIVSGPDGASIFGGQTAAMPAGVSQTPVAPAGQIAQPGTPGTPGTPGQAAPMGGMPGQAAPMGGMPGQAAPMQQPMHQPMGGIPGQAAPMGGMPPAMQQPGMPGTPPAAPAGPGAPAPQSYLNPTA